MLYSVRLWVEQGGMIESGGRKLKPGGGRNAKLRGNHANGVRIRIGNDFRSTGSDVSVQEDHVLAGFGGAGVKLPVIE